MVKATHAPNGDTAYHLDSASEWTVRAPSGEIVNGELYLTILHRQKHLEVQARLKGEPLPDPALVAAEITQAFVKEAQSRPARRREAKRAARGEVVTGWSDTRIEKEQIYRKWSDKVCSGGMWTKGRAARHVTRKSDTGSGNEQSAKIVRRSIELEKQKGRKVVEWSPRGDAGQRRKK